MQVVKDLKLIDYPAAIAELQRELFQLERRLLILKDSQLCIESGLQAKVANDATLTNDTKRKAALTQLYQKDRDLALTRNELLELEAAIADKKILLELRRNEFSVRKLELRQQVAQLEASAA